MMMTDLEIELAKRAVHGDVEALSQLLYRRTDYIYRTAYLYVGNEQDALDVIQEATAQALRGVRKLRDPTLFMTWFTRILIRQAQKVYRTRAKETPQETVADSVPYIQPDAAQHLDVLAAFTTLRPPYRQVLQLFYYQGLSIAEIGRLLDEPEVTVKTRLHRGRVALKKLLGGDYLG